jgi:hypothetical protein
MVDHCGAGRGEAWFAGWERTIVSAERIPTAAHETPTRYLASFISAIPDSQPSR